MSYARVYSVCTDVAKVLSHYAPIDLTGKIWYNIYEYSVLESLKPERSDAS